MTIAHCSLQLRAESRQPPPQTLCAGTHGRAEKAAQAGQFTAVETAQRARIVGQPFPEGQSQPLTLVGEDDGLGPPVMSVRLSPDRAHLLEAIDDAGQIGRVVLQLSGQGSHGHRSVRLEDHQHLRLDGGQLQLGGQVAEVAFEASLHLKPEAYHLALQPEVS